MGDGEECEEDLREDALYWRPVGASLAEARESLTTEGVGEQRPYGICINATPWGFALGAVGRSQGVASAL